MWSVLFFAYVGWCDLLYSDTSRHVVIPDMWSVICVPNCGWLVLVILNGLDKFAVVYVPDMWSD